MADFVEAMVAVQENEPTCSICGETSPGGRWICLTRLYPAAAEAAKASGRCSYSMEAHERTVARFAPPQPAGDET